MLDKVCPDRKDLFQDPLISSVYLSQQALFDIGRGRLASTEIPVYEAGVPITFRQPFQLLESKILPMLSRAISDPRNGTPSTLSLSSSCCIYPVLFGQLRISSLEKIIENVSKLASASLSSSDCKSRIKYESPRYFTWRNAVPVQMPRTPHELAPYFSDPIVAQRIRSLILSVSQVSQIFDTAFPHINIESQDISVFDQIGAATNCLSEQMADAAFNALIHESHLLARN